MKKLPLQNPSLWLFTLGVLSNSLLAQENEAEKNLNTHKKVQERVSQIAEQLLKDGMSPYSQQESIMHITVTGIDPRISIPDCNEPFSVDINDEDILNSHFSARVSCDSENWYSYTTVNVNYTQGVVVTNGTISPGTILSSSHLRTIQLDKSRVPHTTISDIESLLGARVKTRMRDGQPIEKRMLCYVCKGDRITITASLGSMQVKTTGIAQEDGTIGDTISVQNIRSKKIVIGEVKNTEQIEVLL